MNKKIEYKDFRDMMHRQKWLAYLFVLICIVLEVFFWYFPPRGVVAEDVMVLASIKGQPLISFDSFWQRYISDDDFMLKVLDESKVFEGNVLEEKLLFINRQVRQNLNYSLENSVFVKLFFRQAGYANVRKFLNAFSSNLLAELREIGREEFKIKAESADLFYIQAVNRSELVRNFFGINNGVEDASLAAGIGLFEVVGRLIINELRPDIRRTWVNRELFFNSDLEVFQLFPREPRLLSNSAAPPVPVQPFYQLVFLLVPVAMVLLYSGTILILINFRSKNH